MSDYTKIYLQPECCAGEEGRRWCQDDEPESCPDGEKWTPYILKAEYDAVLAANRDLQAWFDDARDDAERLRGRVATQEGALYSIAVALKEAGNLSREMHDLIVTANQGSTHTWLLRKQAEAVDHQVKIEREHFDSYAPCLSRMEVRAQRLRTQADELEAGGGDD